MKLELLQQKINYDSIIEGRHLDLDTYEAKFKMWDYVRENKLENTLEAIRLCNDITIYTYAFFKDDKGEPLKLYAYQDAIGNLKHDFTPMNPNRYILFRAANQIGKSMLLCMLAIFHVMNEKNINVIMISKSLPQSQDLLVQIKQLLNNSFFADSWKEDLGDTANTRVLTFASKDGKSLSRIICAPQGEGTLGYPVHYMYLDELDFYEEGLRFFEGIAKPRTNATKGQIICFSNPNWNIAKTDSVLHKLWFGDIFRRKFHFNFLDKPGNSEEEYDMDKRNVSEYIFTSTHDGDWSDLSGAFFKESEIRDMLVKDWSNNLPAVDRPVFIAVDLGKMKDQTVITIGTVKEPKVETDKYKDLDVRYVEALPLGTEYDKIADKIQELKNYYDKNYYGVARIAFDATGQKTFGDFLKKQGISAFECDFSKKETNKTLLYNDFKLMAEQRKIKIVYDRNMEKQLSGLMFKYSENKKLMQVENKTDEIHDDYPSSIVILIHISVRPSKIPVSMYVIEDQEPQESVDKINPEKHLDDYYRKTIMENRNQDEFSEINKLDRFGGWG